MATNNKYDRQLRLWGAQGQRRLAEANILLLGAHPAGVETLKNLVLPGCGHFTVVDEHVVTERDLGNNFFCSPEHIGEPRAKSVTENLVEMNPEDVQGLWVQESVASKIKDEAFLLKFSIIITNELFDADLRILSKFCEAHLIKLVSIQTNGFYAQLRLQGESHCITESKPERNFFDQTLRIRNPFAGLKEYCDSFDFESMSQSADLNPLAHVPFVVILVKAVAAWSNAHNGALPNSFAEKQEVKAIVQTQMKWLEAKDRENFEEATGNLFWAFSNPQRLPDNLETLFENELSKDFTKVPEKDIKFWVQVAALRQFRDTHDSQLPIDRRLPDMKSTSEWYIALKDVYQRQHNLDREEFIAILNTINPNPQGIVFSLAEDVQPFLDNIYALDQIQFRTIAAQQDAPLELEDLSDNQNHLWFLGQRAVNAFFEKNNRYPNPADAEELKGIAEEIRKALYPAFTELDSSIVKEFCRFEDSKLHNIAAIIGGVASQEAIKLITHQFVPLNNTFVFNGITSEAAVYLF